MPPLKDDFLLVSDLAPTDFDIATGKVKVKPVASPTTNTLTGTKTTGIVSTVNTVAATLAVPVGVLTEAIGFDATGKIVASPPATANNAIVQVGNPNLSPPTSIPTPVKGDIVVQTADGTRTGQLQGSFVWDGTAWVMQSAYSPSSAAVPPNVRQYYSGITLWLERFQQAETAGAIAFRKIAGVGGATVAMSALGGYANSFSYAFTTPLIAQNAANIAALYTPPTAYVRHEVAITPGVPNSYGLKIRSGYADNVVSVWVIDPATNLPAARLHGNCVSRFGNSVYGISLSLGPNEESGIWNTEWEWVQFLIPKDTVATYKTATNTIKLAVLSGLGHGNNGTIEVSGISMSAVGNASS